MPLARADVVDVDHPTRLTHAPASAQTFRHLIRVLREGNLYSPQIKAVKYGDAVSLHRRERLAGRFDRSVTLPVEVDVEGIKAECHDGVLALFLPRAERDKPRTIKIS